jgi:hypothetical protein
MLENKSKAVEQQYSWRTTVKLDKTVMLENNIKA